MTRFTVLAACMTYITADSILSGDEIKVSRDFVLPVTVTGRRILLNAPFRLNIGTSTTYSHMRYEGKRYDSIHDTSGMMYVDSISDLNVEQSTGRVHRMSYVSTKERFKIGHYSEGRIAPMAFTKTKGPAWGVAGELGIGSYPSRNDESLHSYQMSSFVMFPTKTNDMRIVFKDTIDDLLSLGQTRLCSGPIDHLNSHYVEALSQKFVLPGWIGSDVSGLGSRSLIVFESIHDFVEMPRSEYSSFMSKFLSSSGARITGTQGVLDNCSQRSLEGKELPTISFRFLTAVITLSPAQYLRFPNDRRYINKCLVAVRPRENVTHVIAGIPLLRKMMFAVNRAHPVNKISLCNVDI